MIERIFRHLQPHFMQLRSLGWLPQYSPQVDSVAADGKSDGAAGRFAGYLYEAARDYLQFHGLPDLTEPAEIAKVIAKNLRAVRYCNLPDRAEVGQGLRRWAIEGNRIKWAHDGSASARLSASAAIDGFRQALQYWSDVADLEFVQTATPASANIVFGIGKVDGASNTLAWSELPGQGQTSGRLTQLYDASEIWVLSESPRQFEIDFVRVACHEIGHALGMDHIQAGNLLAAMYSNQIRRPQAGDIAAIVPRYGKRRGVPDSPTNPPTTKTLSISISGAVENIEIPGWRCTRLQN